MSGYQHIQVRPVSNALGAEVAGIDLSLTIPENALEALRRAFAEYGVLFFRDQDLTPEDHVRFARCWGEININRFFTPVAGYPMIAEVRKEPEQRTNIGGGWHTDHSYDEIPALGSLLYAREVPEQGGDTLFASMYKAFDGLSTGMQKMLQGMNGVHSSRHVFGAGANRPADLAQRLGHNELATQDAVHPVVISHPLSGRKALYVNPGFTVAFEGWTAEESRPLLDYLYRHASRPEFVCRFSWRPGSLAFWDNRATWHYAVNDYHGERRLLHRITVEGEAL
jgi:taurine dioxygenase